MRILLPWTVFTWIIAYSSGNEGQFKYFEKPTTTNRTLQKNSAMGENAKIQSLSQDMVRRLMNTSEMLGAEVINGIIDTYAQKLTNSGFGMGQVRKIILNGIKGFKNKKRRRTENSGRLRRQAKDSHNSRIRKKLLGKSSWFKGAAGANKKEQYSKMRSTTSTTKGAAAEKHPSKVQQLATKSVIFVEQTNGGELASRIREQVLRMASVVGFKVKVAERTGTNLQNM